MGYIEDLRNIVGNQPLILVGVAVAVIRSRWIFITKTKRWYLGSSWGIYRIRRINWRSWKKRSFRGDRNRNW